MDWITFDWGGMDGEQSDLLSIRIQCIVWKAHSEGKLVEEEASFVFLRVVESASSYDREYMGKGKLRSAGLSDRPFWPRKSKPTKLDRNSPSCVPTWHASEFLLDLIITLDSLW